jgi:transcriptional regulatory protein LevR
MGLNEVFKKVSAINEVTELAKHEVELAGYNFKAYKADFDKVFNTYRDSFRASIKQVKSSVDTYNSNLFNLQKQMDDEYKQLISKAKELGVTVDGSPKQKEYNEMTAILNKAKSNADSKAKEVSVLM